jgi:hypothetical protein
MRSPSGTPSDAVDPDVRTAADGADDAPPIRAVPPAVIGALLLLVIVLAVAFYVAAQVVQTP